MSGEVDTVKRSSLQVHAVFKFDGICEQLPKL